MANRPKYTAVESTYDGEDVRPIMHLIWGHIVSSKNLEFFCDSTDK